MKQGAKAILDRKDAHVQAEPVLEVVNPMMQELINWATSIYSHAAASPFGQTETGDGILVLYLHVIEMIDATARLFASSCVQPAKLLIRGALESHMAIYYMFEADTEQRVRAWRTAEALRRVAGAEDIPRGLPEAPGITHLKQYLKRPDIAAMQQALCTDRRGRPRSVVAWFHLNGGPANLHELARRVGLGMEYDSFTSHWSEVWQIEDIGRVGKVGNAQGYRLRHHGELMPIVSSVVKHLAILNSIIIQWFCREEEAAYLPYMYEVVHAAEELHERYLQEALALADK